MEEKKSWDEVVNDVKNIMASNKLYQPASFLRRISSTLIDLIIIYVILNFMGQTTPISEGIIGFNADTYGFLAILSYSIILECSPLQGTAGKIICGLRVTDYQAQRISFFHSIGRTWAKLITAMTLLIGFATVFFTKRSQALHDLVSRTLVLRDRN